MSQFILINKLKIQNANTIAGFTWGFPTITHFLGYTHNLARKLTKENEFTDINLFGCAVIAHSHHVHTYGKYEAEFTQSRNPAYLKKDVEKLVNQGKTPPVIEEGKMNMTVSLLIGCEGNIGNRKDSFIDWLKKVCFIQRLAGGTVVNEEISIDVFSDEPANLRLIKRKLLPGFILMDRSYFLQEHYESLCETNPETELLDAWLDFSALKKRARPKYDLISTYLSEMMVEVKDATEFSELEGIWLKHLEKPYSSDAIPEDLVKYFAGLESDKLNNKLLLQWLAYIEPNEETDADWEYTPKPRQGYLVPIMVGYKAISPVYEPCKVKNTRDCETPVCFVEAVHSVGEWMSVHRIKTVDELENCLWHYHYEKNWYLCKQLLNNQSETCQPSESGIASANAELDFY